MGKEPRVGRGWRGSCHWLRAAPESKQTLHLHYAQLPEKVHGKLELAELQKFTPGFIGSNKRERGTTVMGDKQTSHQRTRVSFIGGSSLLVPC